ncbi:MAG TPA: segregation/condensation protein A [Planctomycetota bacterium]|jgi:segregation and condensation protein A|nr:segregation/condensation protein A [Planctomycetota bacterium]
MNEQLFELENFRGPLDLLLHLVREQELEITEVDLSRLCDQYLAALEIMRKLDINVAGEFLVMASTLVLIKSRAILPREEVDLTAELDPSDELILQLLEYRKYKTLSLELARRAGERDRRFTRGAHEVPPDEEPPLEEVSLWDLVGTFARLVEELGLQRRFDTLTAQKPLKEYMRAVLDALLEQESWGFQELLARAGGEEAVYGVFLSILELVKSRQVDAAQDPEGGEIRVRLRADRDPSRLAGLFGVPAETPVLESAPEPQPLPGPRDADGGAADGATDGDGRQALADSGADSIV